MSEIIVVNPIQTTDATPTVLMLVETTDYHNGRVRYIVSAIQNDSTLAGVFERVFRFFNDSSTLTISAETDIIVDDDLGVTVAASVSGDNIEITVTGLASTDITWAGEYEQFNHIIEVLPP